MVAEHERQRYFHSAATEMQRSWRGYWSRKFTHSFVARKQYINAVVKAGNELARETNAWRDEDRLRIAQEAHDKMHEEFWNNCKGRHHLVSTAVHPGIFNSPYAEFLGGIPSFDGIPVEDHLNDTFRVPGG
jgi:hypothetical protein